MTKWFDLDGIIHTQGSAECCSDTRKCKCGGRLHAQGSTFGLMLHCEGCDHWNDPPAPEDQPEDQPFKALEAQWEKLAKEKGIPADFGDRLKAVVDTFQPPEYFGYGPSAATIKRQINSDAEGTCQICGATKELVCDEVAHRQKETASAAIAAAHPIFDNRFYRLYALHEGRKPAEQWDWDQRLENPMRAFDGWLTEYWNIFGRQLGISELAGLESTRGVMVEEFHTWLLTACHQKQPGERVWVERCPINAIDRREQLEELIEAAYWRFDTIHKHGSVKLSDGAHAPHSERDAFKQAVRNLISKLREEKVI